MPIDGLHHYLVTVWNNSLAIQRLYTSFPEFAKHHLRQHGLVGYCQSIKGMALSDAATLELVMYMLSVQHALPEQVEPNMSALSAHYGFTPNANVMSCSPAFWRVMINQTLV